jgi:hypothetical protein
MTVIRSIRLGVTCFNNTHVLYPKTCILLQIFHLHNYLKVHISKYVCFTMTKTLDTRTERTSEDDYDCWLDSVTNDIWSLATGRSRSRDGKTDCQLRVDLKFNNSMKDKSLLFYLCQPDRFRHLKTVNCS